MSFLSENIFPGKHGKIFGTNAKYEDDLFEIEKFLRSYDGIKKIELKKDKFPVEIKVYSSKRIKVKNLMKDFKRTGFHLIDKNLI